MSKDVLATVAIQGLMPQHIWPLLSEGPHLECWFAEHAESELPRSLNFWGRFTPDTPGPKSQHISNVAAQAPDAQGHGGRIAFAWQLRGQTTTVEIELSGSPVGSVVSVAHRALGERINKQGALHDFWYSALENLRLYALTGRVQQFVEYGPMPGSSMAVQVDIAASAEEIFRCLVEPEWMAKLWNDKNITVEPVAGGVYDYGWKDGGPRRILAIDPPRLLSFSWLYPPEMEESVVTWRLDDAGGGLTRLSLTHEGFSPGDDHEEYRAGWFSFLAIIKGICELGARWSRVLLSGSAHGET